MEQRVPSYVSLYVHARVSESSNKGVSDLEPAIAEQPSPREQLQLKPGASAKASQTPLLATTNPKPYT